MNIRQTKPKIKYLASPWWVLDKPRRTLEKGRPSALFLFSGRRTCLGDNRWETFQPRGRFTREVNWFFTQSVIGFHRKSEFDGAVPVERSVK